MKDDRDEVFLLVEIPADHEHLTLVAHESPLSAHEQATPNLLRENRGKLEAVHDAHRVAMERCTLIMTVWLAAW